MCGHMRTAPRTHGAAQPRRHPWGAMGKPSDFARSEAVSVHDFPSSPALPAGGFSCKTRFRKKQKHAHLKVFSTESTQGVRGRAHTHAPAFRAYTRAPSNGRGNARDPRDSDRASRPLTVVLNPLKGRMPADCPCVSGEDDLGARDRHTPARLVSVLLPPPGTGSLRLLRACRCANRQREVNGSEGDKGSGPCRVLLWPKKCGAMRFLPNRFGTNCEKRLLWGFASQSSPAPSSKLQVIAALVLGANGPEESFALPPLRLRLCCKAAELAD